MALNKLLNAAMLEEYDAGGTTKSLADNRSGVGGTTTPILNTSGTQSSSGAVGSTKKFDTGNTNSGK